MNIPNVQVDNAMILFVAVLGAAMVWTQADTIAAQPDAKERASIVFAHRLPKLDSTHLKATVVEVNYGPGESSPQHSHPCPVIGNVLKGAYRSQVGGEREAVYKAGEIFYEAPNGVHALSANASQNEPVAFLAYFVCDRDGPLSINIPRSADGERSSR